nr:hypothetical protein [Gammaproteobacteria bacterium]NIX58718.1 hypothetical protein [candidate division Zixibacteria bacterium]
MFRSSSPKKFFYLSLISFVLISFSTQLSAVKWLEQESEHFIVIYRPSHDYLVPHILTSAEKALIPLTKLFNYQPSEKIIINTYDFSDYGRAGTTTVPQNFIRLQIEPLELGYEYLPFTERFQWLISHELVHVVVNDQATNIETVLRFFFSKVNPEATQPMSIFYSLLTNHARYSPRWHQEGIAVFMETWFNGGYGRILGNFDEMYFRSKVAENSAIPTANYLDAKVSYESFLIETLFYLYGARFTAYLAQKYGYQKLVAWYTLLPDDFYNSYEKKFEHVFEVPIEEAWQDFIEVEQEFQRQNLERLKSAPLTSIKPVLKENLGWVTSAYLDSSKSSLILGYHRPHQLT